MNPLPTAPIDSPTNNQTAAPERQFSNRRDRRAQLARLRATKKFDDIELNYIKRAMKGLNA